MSAREAPRFRVYTRAGCALCDELVEELVALPAARGIEIELCDVDAAAAPMRVRYGHKVPVLLYAGELVCHGRLDPEEVDKAVAYHRRPV